MIRAAQIDPAWYARYLRTPAWQNRAADCKRRAGYRCECVVNGVRCGSRFRLHAHHKTYARLGNELPEDLECRCRACHRREHGQAPDPTVRQREQRALERLQGRYRRFMAVYFRADSAVAVRRRARMERQIHVMARRIGE